jgi:hypothetical protein
VGVVAVDKEAVLLCAAENIIYFKIDAAANLTEYNLEGGA